MNVVVLLTNIFIYWNDIVMKYFITTKNPYYFLFISVISNGHLSCGITFVEEYDKLTLIIFSFDY